MCKTYQNEIRASLEPRPTEVVAVSTWYMPEEEAQFLFYKQGFAIFISNSLPLVFTRLGGSHYRPCTRRKHLGYIWESKQGPLRW